MNTYTNYMNEYIKYPQMEYYRQVYKDSKRWDGDSFENKTAIIYGCQGFGDQIQFLRFLRLLKEKGTTPIIHASKKLHRLINHMGYECIDKDCDAETHLPNHDFHILSISLPFALNCPIPLESYIIITEKFDLMEGTNIGIAWEGSPDHEYNKKRSCHLKHFKALTGVNLFTLQPTINDISFIDDAKDVKLYGVELKDFYDTAKLINSLDYIVSVDTAVLHLAGAMEKKSYGLLNPEVMDPRWNYPWYLSIKMLRGTWEEMFKHICHYQHIL